MDKKGYFFILDSFLAMGVLVIGVIMVMSSFSEVPEKKHTTNIAEDILYIFSNTKIKNYNNPYFGSNSDLVKEGYIKDTEKTLLMQLGEFYHNGDLKLAENFVGNVTNDLVPFQYHYDVIIDDVRVFPGDVDNSFLILKNNTEVLFPAKKLSFGNVNDTLELFGPYLLEVAVWQ